MKKYVGFVAALFAMVAVSVVVAKPPSEFQPIDGPDRTLSATTNSGPLLESTGFELVPDGWDTDVDGISICGPEFDDGDCVEPQAVTICSAPGPTENCCGNFPNVDTGWFTSSASLSCTHPMIFGGNPHAGTQHMRQACDAVGGSHQAFTPIQEIAAVGPTTISFWLNGSGTLGSRLHFRAFDDTDSVNSIGVYMVFRNDGTIYVNDYNFATTGTGNTFIGYWAGGGASLPPGVYRQVIIERDPCRTGDFMKYYYDTNGDGTAELLFTHTIRGLMSGAIERANWLQIPGTACTNTWDIDDYVITRGEACPVVCGDGFVDQPETCDGGTAGACDTGTLLCTAGTVGDACAIDDDCDIDPDYGGCPVERCTDCVCAPICTLNPFDPCILENGENGPFIGPCDPAYGCIFLYFADNDTVPASIETCGATGIDTWISFWGSLYYPDGNANDDCCSPADPNCGASFGAGSDPSASCYGPPVQDGSYESCTCWDNLTPGDTYYIGQILTSSGNNPGAGTSIPVTLTKKVTCGTPIAGGACCNGEDGICTQQPTETACLALSDQTTYYDNKTCDLVPPCIRHTGACCDHAPVIDGDADGVCTEPTYPEECAGSQQTWHKGESCSAVICLEALGQCCNTLAGTVSTTTIDECQGAQRVWTKGPGPVVCDAVRGACCDADPFGACTEVTQAECICTKCTWTKLASCSTLDPPCTHNSIPTVSEWGLVVLTLLLLTGAKVYFGRRQTATA